MKYVLTPEELQRLLDRVYREGWEQGANDEAALVVFDAEAAGCYIDHEMGAFAPERK